MCRNEQFWGTWYLKHDTCQILSESWQRGLGSGPTCWRFRGVVSLGGQGRSWGRVLQQRWLGKGGWAIGRGVGSRWPTAIQCQCSKASKCCQWWWSWPWALWSICLRGITDTSLSLLDLCARFLCLLEAELEELGLWQCAMISFSGLGVLGHQTAPHLLGLALFAWAVWHNNADFTGFDTSVALSSPVSPKSIKMVVTYLNGRCSA